MKRKHIFFIATIAAFLSMNTNSLAQTIVIYDTKDYKGKSQALNVGDHNMADIMKGIGNDKLMSIKVQTGYEAILYGDANFSGKITKVTGDVADFATYANAISSIKVVKLPPPVIIYDGKNFQGKNQQLEIGQYDITAVSQGIGNDKLMSIKVAEGYKAILYGNAGFSGKITEITSDVADFQTYGNGISAIKIQKK